MVSSKKGSSVRSKQQFDGDGSRMGKGKSIVSPIILVPWPVQSSNALE